MKNYNKTFSGDNYKGKYPRPLPDDTYESYRERVKQCVAEGFHLGDLSWDDYGLYCKGSGMYEGVDSNEKIGNHDHT